ncbi:ArsA family ATPase [Glutamicibacter sp. PS]|uniref:ArsA family ATPase n=1 Tax=Glutamicibacter sp. PS TaxID=3075634 RepID=UPI0028522356|nr:ArsA family ATPase [Glutamicibacter sp. PS]MDR4534542.1 ArsA family ATPase [Glutamicibacter sp. PS]
MLLSQFEGKKVLFFGGKGGVGKTSLASATALGLAQRGRRVLVVSTDPAHNLGHLWQARLGDEATLVAEAGAGGTVHAVEIDPQRTVDRHLAAVGETMRKMLPERMHTAAERHLRLARQAPGTHESAMLERIAEAVEAGAHEYDLTIFDTAPSGHTLRLLALPEQLGGWTEQLLANRDRSERFSAALRGLTPGAEDGPERRDAQLRRVLIKRRERFANLHRLVTNRDECGFVIALAAEPLPVAESVELAERLGELSIPIAALIANRRSPADAGELLAARREAEDRQLALLRGRLPQIPSTEVPLLSGELLGQHALSRLAEELFGEI